MKVDKRRLLRFKKNLKELGKMKIQIGAIGEHDEAEMTNAELLTIHEFGVPKANIPARAPIRGVFASKKFRKIIEENIQQLVKINVLPNGGLRIKRIADGVGVTVKNLVKANIQKRLSPPNAEETLRRKKGTLPLKDTDQLFNSIEYGISK